MAIQVGAILVSCFPFSSLVVLCKYSLCTWVALSLLLGVFLINQILYLIGCFPCIMLVPFTYNSCFCSCIFLLLLVQEIFAVATC